VEHGPILVIDDDQDVLSTVAASLESGGYSARVTSDPREARALLQEERFALVISDIVMPHLNGLEVLEMVRRDNPSAEVLLITAYSTRDLVAEAIEKGACAVVEKPFDIPHLLDAVSEGLRRAALKQQDRSG
jgi:DNA-binding NtrC family response regulator